MLPDIFKKKKSVISSQLEYSTNFPAKLKMCQHNSTLKRAVHGNDDSVRTAAHGILGAGPKLSDVRDMADVRHMEGDPLHPGSPSGPVGGIKSFPRPILDLETALSHFWMVPKKAEI